MPRLSLVPIFELAIGMVTASVHTAYRLRKITTINVRFRAPWHAGVVYHETGVPAANDVGLHH